MSTQTSDSARENATSSSQRLTLDLTPDAAQEVDRLRVLTGLTKADLFRHGFNLMRLYVKAHQEGKEFCIIDADGRERVVQLPLIIAESRNSNV